MGFLQRSSNRNHTTQCDHRRITWNTRSVGRVRLYTVTRYTSNTSVRFAQLTGSEHETSTKGICDGTDAGDLTETAILRYPTALADSADVSSALPIDPVSISTGIDLLWLRARSSLSLSLLSQRQDCLIILNQRQLEKSASGLRLPFRTRLQRNYAKFTSDSTHSM